MDKTIIEDAKAAGLLSAPSESDLHDNPRANEIYEGKLAKIIKFAQLREARQSSQSEQVAELIFDPEFLPAMKVPLVDWKIDLMALDVGTKFYLAAPQQAIPAETVAWLCECDYLDDHSETMEHVKFTVFSKERADKFQTEPWVERGACIHQLTKQPIENIKVTALSASPTAPIESEFLEAVREVIRISDRKHDAWDKVKEYL